MGLASSLRECAATPYTPSCRKSLEQPRDPCAPPPRPPRDPPQATSLSQLTCQGGGGQFCGMGSLAITKSDKAITKSDRLISASGRARAALPKQSDSPHMSTHRRLGGPRLLRPPL